MNLTKANVYKCLSTVIDPELGIDVVSMGLVYDVNVGKVKIGAVERNKVHILMTLTSPGCPLIGAIQQMMIESLSTIDDLDIESEVELELTFDPPWIADMMTEEAKAELGF